MGDVVNLNKFRKGKEREARKQLVAVNRHKFARPKAELVRLDSQRGKEAAALDAHRLDEQDDSVMGDAAHPEPDAGQSDEGGDRSGEPAPDRPGQPRETD